ncbi:hypothetical protein [Streptomyces sp. PTD9-10]|uniref:hypothetical protein n=2 Tax=unclassified Streptomyces TaxID=2593676 RepID=UPI00300B5844
MSASEGVRPLGLGERFKRVAQRLGRAEAHALGLMITRQGQKFGVWNIDRIFEGHLAAHMLDLVATEDEARKIANREWVGMGL